jgi:hypothetical protein
MATDEDPKPLSLQQEITSSLAGVWKRYTGERPTGAATDVTGNVVTCTIPDSASAFDAGLAEGEDDPAGRLVRYRRDAAAGVARSTHCRVVAMVSERDADTDVSREIFFLDTAPKRPSFGEAGWIAS